MKPIKITWKSTYCGYIVNDFKGGTEYRVRFEDIPDYIKKEWMEYADGVCSDDEINNPMVEIQAILMPNGDIRNIEVKYFFDDYEYFELTPDDKEEALTQFVDFIKANDYNLPDAYNAEEDSLMGDGEWELCFSR